jgi:cytochrome c5
MLSQRVLSVIALGALLVAGCSKSAAPPAESSQSAAPSSQAAPAPPASAPAAAFNMSSIFPPGPGKDMVLNTCSSCHSVTCAATGQRTKDRWDNIEKSHKDKLTSYSPKDVDVMFTYMKDNFNDSKPEPKIPAELQGQGCTPF